ncbi:hypothetical protein ACO0M4_05915 [Streptomyces sp. RGM 3693]|uniref:hypothetical protein n=1 Tax=Streptomyces sp. RGM 3693 TaxID=3413284 RepID=UPI003D2D57F2
MTKMTVLERAAAAADGNELDVLRQDAHQVITAARQYLADPCLPEYEMHVLKVEAIIGNLLSSLEGADNGPARCAVIAFARGLVRGEHHSRGYPPHRRLRILLNSAALLYQRSSTPLPSSPDDAPTVQLPLEFRPEHRADTATTIRVPVAGTA